MVTVIKKAKEKNNQIFQHTSYGIGYYESPIGLIKIGSCERGITELNFIAARDDSSIENDLILETIKQLDEYFNGTRREFDLPIVLEGTEFQIKVWENLLSVKYGMTASYKDIAVLISNDKAVRAVGGANNRNPVAIIIPCHRIIGKNGKLIGYGGGLDKKQWLLDHENKNR